MRQFQSISIVTAMLVGALVDIAICPMSRAAEEDIQQFVCNGIFSGTQGDMTYESPFVRNFTYDRARSHITAAERDGTLPYAGNVATDGVVLLWR